jgi:hypothetical protein
LLQISEKIEEVIDDAANNLKNVFTLEYSEAKERHILNSSKIYKFLSDLNYEINIRISKVLELQENLPNGNLRNNNDKSEGKNYSINFGVNLINRI